MKFTSEVFTNTTDMNKAYKKLRSDIAEGLNIKRFNLKHDLVTLQQQIDDGSYINYTSESMQGKKDWVKMHHGKGTNFRFQTSNLVVQKRHK